MEREKLFTCPTCLREFSVTVEPMYDGDEMAPEEAEWLEQIQFCPCCTAIVEAME